MIEFHTTGMGRKFFEGTLPAIAKSLAGIEEALKKQVEFNEEFRNAVEVNQKASEDDPLTAVDKQYEAEYYEIDEFVWVNFPEDYAQGEKASMQLGEFVISLLTELKERRRGAEVSSSE